MTASTVARRCAIALCAAIVCMATAPAAAQNVSATIYRDTSFRGPAVAVKAENRNLQLRFPVYSIRIASGEWELCSQPNFRGTCITVLQSSPDLRRSHNWNGPLQSMRPTNDGSWSGGGVGGGSGGGWGPGSGSGSQQSLRGMASEFFPAPRQGRNPNSARVQACPGGNATPGCAAQTADRFCRTAGWNGSARELMETVNRRIYLADVLCVLSGY